MKFRIGAVLLLTMMTATLSASIVEKIRNKKVLVTEDTLAPGQAEQLSDKLPSVVVYMTGGRAEIKRTHGNAQTKSVNEGQTVFQPAEAAHMVNAGSRPLHFVRIEFLTPGGDETWGMTGLPPNYKMLLENRYARAYDIKIAARAFEQRHTHHDRVVVSLSGAKLEHILPSGQVQPSTLKTGEVVWRLAATHVGHNLGDTNLWVIAVEPK